MTANDREVLREVFEQEYGVVVAGSGPGTGAVSGWGVVHHQANGSDSPVLSMAAKQGNPNWGKADLSAELVDVCTTRHARGIAGGGLQQYTLNILRAESGKPTAVLPFTRASLPAVVGGTAGYGGLASPSESPQGQAMRLLEQLAQGSFAQVGHVTGTMATLLDRLSVRLSESEKRSDDRAKALMDVLAVWQQQQISTQVRALMIDGARRILPLLPALASTTTGLDVPTDVAEASFFDAMVEAYPAAQLKAYVSSLTPPANAVAADMLLKAQRRKAQRQADQQSTLSFDEASEDAAGRAWRSLNGRTAPDPDPGARIVKGLEQHEQQNTNGQSNGHTAKADDGAALLDELIAMMPDAHGALVSMIEQKDPALAARLQRRLDAHKEGASTR